MFWAGIGTMGEGDEPLAISRDHDGRPLSAYDLCVVNKVPDYMWSTYVANNPGEMLLAERVKSLVGRIGLVIRPDHAPELSWHSRDRAYVNLRFKLIDNHDLHGKAAIWTYEQYFPTNVLSRMPINVFLSDVLLQAPQEFDTVDVIGEERFRYMASVLNAKSEVIAGLHDEAVRMVLGRLHG